MFNRIAFIIMLMFAFGVVNVAQNATDASATRKRTVAANTGAQDNAAEQKTTPKPSANNAAGKQSGTNAKAPASNNVLDTFNALLDGIRAADVKVVTGIYWNSPQLVLFNNNGTVTKGWEQMRKNRESSYKDLKDVVLETRDVRVQMLGRDAALVTCQWTQGQTFRDVQETASGRMTIVFRRIAKEWKAIHLHTSPDAPDPSRILPSEQMVTPTAPPKP